MTRSSSVGDIKMRTPEGWLYRVRHVAKDCRGGSAAEFALIVMPMVALTFAIIEFGSLLFIWNEMKGAARETVRCASVADTFIDGVTLQCGAQTVGTAEDIACNILTNWWPTFTISLSQQVVTGGNDFDVTITTPMPEIVVGYPLRLVK